MSPELQVKLLRVVQEREYSRLGESDTRQVNARIIAATHIDLEKAVRERRFREDLYYRLRVVPIAIPPLRQRPEDVGPLAHHLLARITSRVGRALQLSPDALEVMARYPWPGNVRQLENALEYAVALCQGQTLQVEHLPPEVRMDVLEPERATSRPAPFARSSTRRRCGPLPCRLQRRVNPRRPSSCARRWTRTAGTGKRRRRPWASVARLCGAGCAPSGSSRCALPTARATCASWCW